MIKLNSQDGRLVVAAELTSIIDNTFNYGGQEMIQAFYNAQEAEDIATKARKFGRMLGMGTMMTVSYVPRIASAHVFMRMYNNHPTAQSDYPHTGYFDADAFTIATKMKAELVA